MPKFVNNAEYYRAGFYLTWTTVIPRDTQWSTFDERDAHSQAIKKWCIKNAKGRYSWTNATRYVKFELAQDAALFKLVFG